LTMNSAKIQKWLVLFMGLQIVLISTVAATGKGARIIYRGGREGKVVFDGRIHAGKGFTCRDCHTDYMNTGLQLFETHKKGLISFEDHEKEAKCFACHNGKTVFAECSKCHR